jgi:protein-disulfide isomerase
MPKKVKKTNYSFLVAGSFLALVGFFVIYSSFANSLFSRQVVLSSTSEKFYTPRNFVKTNTDPLITKASDYYQSFVRNYTPVAGGGHPAVIIFCDFTAASCRDVWQKLMAVKAQADFTLAWKNFPAAVGDTSRRAGLAALCAQAQNKFLDYADLLFANQNDLGIANLRSLAKQAGLALDAFNSCLTDEKMLQLLGQDLADGQNLMIDRVPYLFVGNSRVESSQIGNLEKIIESER